MKHRYHIKYRESKRLKSAFVLDVHKDWKKVQTLDVEEAVVSTTEELSQEALDAVSAIFEIEEVGEVISKW